MNRPTELKLAAPKPFTGNQEDLNGFLLNLNLYLTINREIYDDSFNKIRYDLSFMTSGDAKSWKDQYLEESNKGEYLDLGTWSEFTKALRESFEPYDAPGGFCPEKRKASTSTSSSTSPPSYAPSPATSKKMNPKELVGHIRSVTAQMRPEEKGIP